MQKIGDSVFEIARSPFPPVMICTADDFVAKIRPIFSVFRK